MPYSNGVTKELLERARVLSQRDSAPEETRLILTLMIGVYDRIDYVLIRQEKVETKVERIYTSITQRLSRFVETNPKVALGMAIVAFLALSLFWVSDTRRWILVWLGLPPDLLSPLP
jgi:hypothetical protein